jgi:hypothetical protein
MGVGAGKIVHTRGKIRRRGEHLETQGKGGRKVREKWNGEEEENLSFISC